MTQHTHETHTTATIVGITATVGNGRFRAIVERTDDDIRAHVPSARPFYVEVFDHAADAVAFEDTFDTFEHARDAALDTLEDFDRDPDGEDSDWGSPTDYLVTDPHDPYFNDAVTDR